MHTFHTPPSRVWILWEVLSAKTSIWQTDHWTSCRLGMYPTDLTWLKKLRSTYMTLEGPCTIFAVLPKTLYQLDVSGSAFLTTYHNLHIQYLQRSSWGWTVTVWNMYSWHLNTNKHLISATTLCISLDCIYKYVHITFYGYYVQNS